MEKTLLSVVSPVYRAEKIVDELVKRIAEEVSKITTNFEIILVEDGSPDNSWAKIAENCAKYPFVKGIKLSRNFGQHYAITAALHHAQGEYVVLMDCDLQDNPKYIIDLYAKAQEGYDIVYTKKEERKHSIFKNITAKMFFWVFNYLADNQNADDKTGSFSLLSRKVVEAFCRIQDYHRHYLMVIRFLGFKNTSIQIVHEKRFEGRSSYNLSKLINHALNGITSQSDKLLRLSITVGFSFFVLAILWAFYLLIGFFIHGALAGYTSLMVALLLSTGIILMSIGVLGIYIGKIFEQVKQRPLYLIDTKINFNS
jgi:dolichol-phosphate mannosyltransferase